MATARRVFLALLAAGALASCGGDDADAAPPPAAPAGPADDRGAPPGGGAAEVAPRVRVWFKLDRSLTDGLYMGERWVSPPVFTVVKAAPQVVLELRAQHVDSQRNARDVSATWTASDPGMVGVSAGEGHEVTVTLLRSGQSTLTVAHGADAAELSVTAAEDAGVWRVDVAQPP